MRAKDVLPDDVNEDMINGVSVRKGTVGAFVINAKIFCNPTSTTETRMSAECDIVEAIPALRALGLFDVMEVRDDKLRSLIESH